MTRTLFLSCLAALGLGLAAACSPSDDTPTGCDGVRIERFRELVIVDEAVVSGARASNAARGPFGFAHAMVELGGGEREARELARGWLAAWDAAEQGRVRARVTCPWLRRTAGNGCDTSCARCEREELDLDVAPFRLAAIANRLDLGEHPDALSDAGEGRLVFALVDGAGDDPRAPAMEATVIFEYAQPAGRLERAAAWHALSRHVDVDDAYQDALARVTEAFVARRGGAPPALAQIRVDDAAIAPSPVLRELALDPTGRALVFRGLRNTPRPDLDADDALARWVRANEDDILHDRHVVPEAMRAASIGRGGRWALPSAKEDTRKAFSLGTCNGCHGDEAATLGGFHVSPSERGPARLSRFLHDPGHGRSDDLARREDFAAGILCRP